MYKILLLLIKIYKIVLSPLLGKNCKFFPTCSSYTYNSIEKYGQVNGMLIALKRIIKCNFLFFGGNNPVP